MPDTVYPRWRGEHGHEIIIIIRATGLSPLARGTPLYRFCNQKDWRFIPAGAGNTEDAVDGAVNQPVYPRWRGEHGTVTGHEIIIIGLSPLARGTLEDDGEIDIGLRFIPAGAGNTRRAGSQYSPHSVYPRWRGEHASDAWRATSSTGLSPLARGTLDKAIKEAKDMRFIPAGAGNTGEKRNTF